MCSQGMDALALRGPRYGHVDPPSPGCHPSGRERFDGVGVAQHFLLIHFIQDVLAQHSGQAQLPAAHQPEHQVHQQLEDLLCQFHQAERKVENAGKASELRH